MTQVIIGSELLRTVHLAAYSDLYANINNTKQQNVNVDVLQRPYTSQLDTE